MLDRQKHGWRNQADEKGALGVKGFDCEPHHPNAWGGLFNRQISEHGLIDTGWRSLSTRAAGHKREIKIWRKP